MLYEIYVLKQNEYALCLHKYTKKRRYLDINITNKHEDLSHVFDADHPFPSHALHFPPIPISNQSQQLLLNLT
ncbi:hypothetical protein L1987_77399 [Smallanthus sonchifolius]|uniref:Uncharacterized protein n=1 Tax=Smallanthus sonchifolius TaxID=185202 RepID=A0ACB8ZAW3_9ASTR|nr:hypothetical protein L1987_77399 [Smallanthus sonchifolius]